jgi:hypothetical protein
MKSVVKTIKDCAWMWLTHQFSTARGKASVVGTCDINKDLHETSQDSCVCVCACVFHN